MTMIMSSPDCDQCSMSGLTNFEKFAISAPASPAPIPAMTNAMSLY